MMRSIYLLMGIVCVYLFMLKGQRGMENTKDPLITAISYALTR